MGDDVVMDMAEDGNLLLPLDDGERSIAFFALTDALAAIAAVMPRPSCAATEAAQDEHCEEIAQHPDGHRSGAVVHLSERLASRTTRLPD
jgi:hypothetical protein